MRTFFRLTAVAILLGMFAGACNARAADTRPDANWAKGLQQWRSERATELTTPDGWFSLVGLEWLKPGPNSFGTSADSQIHVPAPTNSQLGILDVEQDGVQLKAPKGGFPKGLQVDGHAAQEQAIVVDGRNPSKIAIGTQSLFVIRRGDSLLLRIKDSQAPALRGFHGLHWYQPDLRYRIEATWVPFENPRPIVVQDVIGKSTNGLVFGEAQFTLDGQKVALQAVVQDDKAKSLLFVIRDATSGKSTYAASRFLHTDLPDHGLSEPGKLLLDFNQLENPPCAYTPYATCPLPPASNRLKVALTAGELKYSH